MKKVLMISALAFAVGSTSALAANVYKDDTTSVDVYGYAKGAHVFNQIAGKNGYDKSEAQIGIKAKQQLNDTFALIGQYEGEYDVNDTNARHWHNRKALGGIDAGKYGTATVGRQQGVLYNVIGMSDMHPEVVSGWSSAPDKGLFGRADNVIQLQNTVDGVTYTTQYKLKSTHSLETGQPVDQDEAYGASVVGDNIADSGFFAGAAAASQKQKGGDSHVYSVGGGYTKDGVYVAATSTFGKNVGKAKSFYDNEVIGQYTFTNGITPSLGYVVSNDDGKKAEFVETGLTYAFNKNVSADVGYGIDVTGSDNNQVKTGIKYKF